MENKLYSEVLKRLGSGQKLILVRIIRRSGSAPRDVGAMCAITEKGELIGTIGGGSIEHQTQKQAVTLIKEGKSLVCHFTMTNDDPDKSGMICGGEVDLFMEPLFPSSPGAYQVFKAVKEGVKENKTGWLVTRIANGIHAMEENTRIFYKEDGGVIGAIPGFQLEKQMSDIPAPFELITFNDGEKTVFVEKITPEPQVFLFGAGHVSTFVAKLAKMVGFNITVIDDRAQFANKENFPWADKILVSDFDQAFNRLSISHNACILIITRGHQYDKLVLENALGTNAAYIGMIGSTRKRDAIYRALMKKGFSKERLETVYSPIGLDIRAQTPEEIAVSIVGELIQIRAPQKKKKKKKMLTG